MLGVEFFRDTQQSVTGASTWLQLGWDDIRRRYQRSKLGPLWLTGGLAAMTIGMGILFSQIMQTSQDEYLRFLCAGLAVWLFISATISESCDAFVASAGIIKNYQISKVTLIMRVIWRNIIAFLHYMVFYVLLVIYLGAEFSIQMLWALPGLILIAIPIIQISLIFAIISARFRDVSQMTTQLLQGAFFVTPIIWEANQISHGMKIMAFNPFHHLVSVVRDPLNGQAIDSGNVLALGIMIVVLFFFLIPIYQWGRSRVVHWV